MSRSFSILVLACAVGSALAGTAAAQSRLSVQGQPYFDGQMEFSLEDPDHPGAFPLIAYGLTPLATPLPSDWGPWYIGLLLAALPLPPLDGAGDVHVLFTMPSEDPSAVGIHLVLQGYVEGVLSNPATIPMAYPYFVPESAIVITSPNPMQQASFGDRLALGDLNDDGHTDIVVGAWFEDFAGLDKSGRVYIFWGPEYSSQLALGPVDPKPWGELGIGIAIDDLDGDGIDDLVAAEDGGDGTTQDSGYLHVYFGSPVFPTSPSIVIASPATGFVYSFWGRALTTGDFNDDGFGDIAIGVDKATVAGLTEAGRVDVYWGPTFATRVEVYSPTPAEDDNFGVRVTSGDANGDGIDDLIESSCGDDAGGLINVGSAHVFAGPALQLLKTIPNPLPDGHLT